MTTVDLPALHRASVDGSLALHYQPEVDLATGAIVAMEALLRWHHPVLGELAPARFLGLAERSGEMGPIGAWVLREGAREAAAWRGLRGPARQLRLNIGREQLLSVGFADRVAAAVAQNALPFGALGLEIGEDVIRGLGADATAVLADVRSAGVALAVDDVDSFYTTLGVIEVLPVDVVKLGQRHVRGIDLAEGTSIAQTVITRAHARGLIVVAEGVETWGEAARLIELGCDRAHGWLYAGAQRADRARWLLEQGTGWAPGAVPVPRSAS